MSSRTLLSLVASLALVASAALANDWPQWRGPNRDDVSKETGLLKSWPKEGPKLLWTYTDAGVGYSGPAIVGDRLLCAGVKDDKEIAFALDVTTGKELWSTPIGPLFKNRYGSGPRCTPTVDGDALYLLGGQGNLACLETGTGKQRWTANMQKDFSGQMMSGWGYSESPLVDGEKLICTPGGDRGTIAALDKKTGKLIWRSTDVKSKAAYSSPIVAEVGGVRQYIQLTRDGIIGVAAKDGKLLWKSPLGGCGTAAVPTPIFHDGYVFATSGYNDSQDGLIHLTSNGGIKADEVYSGRTLVNKHGGVVLLDGVLYGASEAGGPWVALDFKTGKKLGWDGRKLAKGSVTYADGRLYLYSEDNGTVVLLEPNPKEWKETGRFKIPQQTKLDRGSGAIWTHPVVANGKLYLRDLDLLFCFDIRETAAVRKP